MFESQLHKDSIISLNLYTLMDHEEYKKTFVREGGEATIVCPKCFKSRDAKVTHPTNKKPNFKVKCTCTHTFKIQLEFRKSYRKDTLLVGHYTLESPARAGGTTEIINLSETGLCFKVRGVHNIKEGNHGLVEFTLDNRKRTEMTKHFIVRNVSANNIGCEFLDQQAFERELGFYLRH